MHTQSFSTRVPSCWGSWASGIGQSDAIDARLWSGRNVPGACGIRENQSAKNDANYDLAELGSRYSGGAALLAGSNPGKGADPRAVVKAADYGDRLEGAEEDVGKD